MPRFFILRLVPSGLRGLALVALLGGATPAALAYLALSQLHQPSTVLRGPVVSVADGDTLTVLAGGRRVRVRLLGIDAPESSSLRYGRPQCGGAAAKAALSRWRLRHPVVTVRTDRTQDSTDRYGRTLAYVTAGNESAQAALLTAGLAKVYVYDRTRPFQRAGHYRALAAHARAQRAGVWSTCGGFR